MKIEKAIEILIEIRKDQKLFTPLGQACHVAISVLEKQIPKRPYADNNGNYAEYFESWLECPKCGEAISEYTAENNIWCYCSGCGQKLDWSDEND